MNEQCLKLVEKYSKFVGLNMDNCNFEDFRLKLALELYDKKMYWQSFEVIKGRTVKPDDANLKYELDFHINQNKPVKDFYLKISKF